MWLSLPVWPALSRLSWFLRGHTERMTDTDPAALLSFHMTKCEASARVKLFCVLASNQRTLASVNVIGSVSCLNTHTFKAVMREKPDNRTEICLNYINRPDFVFSIVLNVHKASRCPCIFCFFRKTEWQKQHEEIAVMQRQQNDSRHRPVFYDFSHVAVIVWDEYMWML